MPTELDEVTRRIMQLEIEEAALGKETDRGSQERLKTLQHELSDLKEVASGMRAQWEKEKEEIHKVRNLREKLERLRRELEEAEGNYDLNKAAELRHGKIPEVEKRIKSSRRSRNTS